MDATSLPQPGTPPPTTTIMDVDTSLIVATLVTRAAWELFHRDGDDANLAGTRRIRRHYGARFRTVLTRAVVLHTRDLSTGRGVSPVEAVALFFDELQPLTLELVVKRVLTLVYAELIASYEAETGVDPFSSQGDAARAAAAPARL